MKPNAAAVNPYPIAAPGRRLAPGKSGMRPLRPAGDVPENGREAQEWISAPA
jgi:hypothetical protein